MDIFSSNKSKYQNQHQEQRQEQIVNQNFANNILFMNMSVLQEIQQKINGQRKDKVFGNYDVVDYSHRPLEVLKEQLRLGLFQVEISYSARTKHGKDNYKLPSSYDLKQVFNTLSGFKQYFREVKQFDCLDMTQDLINILQGKSGPHKFHNMKFQSEGSQPFNKQVNNMFTASHNMRNEEEQTMKYFTNNPDMREEDIKFRGNTKNYSNNNNYNNNNNNNYNKSSNNSQTREFVYQNGNYVGEAYFDDYHNTWVPHGNGKLSYADREYEGNLNKGLFEGITIERERNGRTWEVNMSGGKEKSKKELKYR